MAVDCAGTPSESVERPSADTSIARLMAWLPLLQSALVMASVMASRGSTTWAFLGFVLAFGLVASAMLARSDRRELSDRGFTRLPSPLWALVMPLAYLIIRAHRIHSITWDGLHPVWNHLGAIALVLVVLLMVQLWGGAAVQLGLLF